MQRDGGYESFALMRAKECVRLACALADRCADLTLSRGALPKSVTRKGEGLSHSTAIRTHISVIYFSQKGPANSYSGTYGSVDFI